MLMRYKLKFDGLVDEMLSKLPEEVWQSTTTTFFDPAMAGGQFIGKVIEKLRSYGHSDENIGSRVNGMEDSKLMVTATKNKYKIGTYWVGDINYEFEKEMKFDIVLGNPPYQETSNKQQVKGVKSSSNSGLKIWAKFVKLGKNLLNENGYLLFITPYGWTCPVNAINEEFSNGELLYANLNSKSIQENYFRGVGGNLRFTWWVQQKGMNVLETETVFEDDVTAFIDWKSKIFTPAWTQDYRAFTILQKIFSKTSVLNWSRGGGTAKNAKLTNDAGNIKCYHTAKETKYSDIPAENTFKHKLLVYLTSTGGIFYDYGSCYSSCYCAVFSSEEEAKYFETLFQHKLYKFVFGQIKVGGIVNSTIRNIKIPNVIISTDAELYEYFGLTQEEIKLIEKS